MGFGLFWIYIYTQCISAWLKIAKVGMTSFISIMGLQKIYFIPLVVNNQKNELDLSH